MKRGGSQTRPYLLGANPPPLILSQSKDQRV